MKPDSRFPYTYACDYLRTKVGAHISRSEMSQIRSLIAEVLDMDDNALAIKLADKYMKLTSEEFERAAKESMQRAGHA
jgi:hypothetical protein